MKIKFLTQNFLIFVISILWRNFLDNKIKNHFKGDLKNKTFCIWGLSFKPKTDDMREAPALVLIDALVEAGAKIQAYDPVAMHEAKHLLKGKAELKNDAISAAKNADAIVLVTEWPEFRLPDWEVVCKIMKQNVMFDGRNIYHRKDLQQIGFTYYGIGISK